MIHYCPGVGTNASKKRNLGILSNSKGQGTVEYILILVVSVALVLGLATQFYLPVRNWVSNYFGEYLQCLLETGELPSMGSTQNRRGICDASFKAFSLADGRPYEGSGGGKGSTSANNKDQEEKQAGDKSGETASSSKSVGESGSARGRRFGSSFSNSAGSGGGGGDPTKRKTEETYTGSVGLYTPGSSVIDKVERTRKSRYVGIAGLTQQEKDKVEKERLKTRKIANEGGSFQDKKKMRVQRALETKKEVVRESQGGIGEWLRILLIILIIIAILFFLLGQANQITKSWEK